MEFGRLFGASALGLVSPVEPLFLDFVPSSLFELNPVVSA